jgi:hypothetical protein
MTLVAGTYLVIPRNPSGTGPHADTDGRNQNPHDT